MSLRDGKTLFNILKPKKGEPPAFREIPYDDMILDNLKSSPTLSSNSEPSVLILCGPPGCGKSTIKSNLLREFGIENFVNIDPDEIRTVLMSQGVTFPDDKTMAGITNNFNKRISDFSLEERYNILFDTTGQNFRAVSDLLYQSRERGYKTYFVVIYASLETCQRRVQMRNEKLKTEGSGRIQLPLEIAAQIYSGFMQPKGTASMFLVDYPVKANQVLLYNNDTDGTEPELLYRKNGENVEFVTDFSGFYNMNIISLPPYIIKSNSGGKRRRRRTKRNKTIRNKRKTRKH